METPGMPIDSPGVLIKNKSSAAVSLKDGEYPQNEEEQVEHSQEKGNG